MVIDNNKNVPKVDLTYLQLLVRRAAMSHFVGQLLLENDPEQEVWLQMATILLQDLNTSIERHQSRDQQTVGDIQPMPDVMD